MLKKESLCGSSSAIDNEFQDNDLNMHFGTAPSFSRLLEFSSSCCRKIEFSTNALNKMDKLILLQLNHVKLNGPFTNFPKGLRGLCMHGFQSEYIPFDLPMEHLVALDMSFSDLKQLWTTPKFLRSLKYLNLSYSKLVTIGGFEELPALERLILTRCESLTHVCESIGECDKCGGLVFLNLSYCSKLKNLPIIIRKLKYVKVLTLDGCGAGVLDKERKRMKLLNVPNKDSVSKKLQAFFSFITRLVPINSQKSVSLSLPSSLVTLSLTNNNLSSESFPVDFSSMSLLKSLFLDGNPIDSIPDCLKSLSRLEVLSVGGCSMMKSILCPPGTIKRLYADDCDLLEKITLHQDMSAPPLLCCFKSVSLTDIEGIVKIQDLAQVDSEIICSLGWTDIHFAKDYEVVIFNVLVDKIKKLRVKVLSQSLFLSFRISLCFQICKNVTQIGFYSQMLYEFGIFSTWFPGKEVPKWFAHRRNGSSISFTMPSSSANKRIEGINICFVQTFSADSWMNLISTKVKNITKDSSWAYSGYIGALGYADEDIVWLSHWMFGNNDIEEGDEVSVTILEIEEDGRVMVSECGMSFVYSDRDKESVDHPLSYYKSWKHIIGRDLSAFESTSGNYFLSNYQFCPAAYDFKENFYSETRFKKSFEVIPIPSDGTRKFNHGGQKRRFNVRQDTRRRQQQQKVNEEDEASILNEFADEFRLPINQRPTENVDLDHVEQASLDTQLPSSNVGFRLLQKMGWKGKGLGKNEQGITEPIKSGIRDAKLGLGKQEEDDFFTAEENIQRKKLDIELEETEEVAKKREVMADREIKIETEVKEIRKSFYCELCNKQYKLAVEFEGHLSSYDHNHRKMKEMHGSSGRDERQKREQLRQEKEMAKADAHKQQQQQLQQQEDQEDSEKSNLLVKSATVLADQDQRKALKFGFSSKFGGSKSSVKSAAKEPKIAVASVFGNDSDEE
ncbi:Toll/interleukin-1 receptor domain-containing protein [Tanacetum coccineum]